jgi:hypothetical protein
MKRKYDCTIHIRLLLHEISLFMTNSIRIKLFCRRVRLIRQTSSRQVTSMSPSKVPPTDPHSIPLLTGPQDDEEQQRLDPNQPLYTPHPPSKRSVLNRYSWIVAAALLILFIGLLVVPTPSHNPKDTDDDYDDDTPIPDSSEICKQLSLEKLPDDDILRALATALNSDEYLRDSVQRLSGAVKIPTESYDDMGPVGEDSRWDVFGEFHEYLEKTYPHV